MTHVAHLTFFKSRAVIETPSFQTAEDLDFFLDKSAARGAITGRIVDPGKTDLAIGSEALFPTRQFGGYAIRRVQR